MSQQLLRWAPLWCFELSCRAGWWEMVLQAQQLFPQVLAENRNALIKAEERSALVEHQSGISASDLPQSSNPNWDGKRDLTDLMLLKMGICLDLYEKASYRCYGVSAWVGTRWADTRLFRSAYVESLEAPLPTASIDPDCSRQGSINPPNLFPSKGHGGFFSIVNVFLIKTFWKHGKKHNVRI